MTPADFGLDDPWLRGALFLAVFALAFGIGTRR